MYMGTSEQGMQEMCGMPIIYAQQSTRHKGGKTTYDSGRSQSHP